MLCFNSYHMAGNTVILILCCRKLCAGVLASVTNGIPDDCLATMASLMAAQFCSVQQVLYIVLLNIVQVQSDCNQKAYLHFVSVWKTKSSFATFKSWAQVTNPNPLFFMVIMLQDFWYNHLCIDKMAWNREIGFLNKYNMEGRWEESTYKAHICGNLVSYSLKVVHKYLYEAFSLEVYI